MKLKINIEGNAFIFFCLSCDDYKKDKCAEGLALNDGEEIKVSLNKEADHIKQTSVPFSSTQVMYGLSSYSSEGRLLPIKLELGVWGIEIISLTVVADSVSAKIS